MTVYVDDMRRPARVGRIDGIWSHLQADTPEELMAFALRMGLDPRWIQHRGTVREHFDLTDARRDMALRLGARAMRYGHEGAALMKAKREERTFDLDAYRDAHPDEIGWGDEQAGEQLDLF